MRARMAVSPASPTNSVSDVGTDRCRPAHTDTGAPGEPTDQPPDPLDVHADRKTAPTPPTATTSSIGGSPTSDQPAIEPSNKLHALRAPGARKDASDATSVRRREGPPAAPNAQSRTAGGIRYRRRISRAGRVIDRRVDGVREVANNTEADEGCEPARDRRNRAGRPPRGKSRAQRG